MLVNLAASHTDVVSESKKKAEAVLAAPTKKQAGSLARVEGGGGISCFPDNVGKVSKAYLFGLNLIQGKHRKHHDPFQEGESFIQFTLTLVADNRVESTHLRCLDSFLRHKLPKFL